MKKISLVSFVIIEVCLSACTFRIAGKEVFSVSFDRKQTSASPLSPGKEKNTRNKGGGLFSQGQPSPQLDAQPKVVSTSRMESNPSVKAGVKGKAERLNQPSKRSRERKKGKDARISSHSEVGSPTRKETSSGSLRSENPPTPGKIWYYDKKQGWIQI